MRIPEAFCNCTFFIGARVFVNGNAEVRWLGTAFAVSVPSERFPNTAAYRFLVTARHVAAQLPSQDAPLLRVNLRGGGGAGHVKLEGSQWWYHPTDSSVDVAVMPFRAWRDDLEIMEIAQATFTTSAMMGETIGIGDATYTVGLFAHAAGEARNMPILRAGNLAMLPGEQIQTALGLMDAYLIEARSIGGISGSPVFVQGSNFLHSCRVWVSAESLHLLGLMHGHWDLPPEAKHDMAAPLANAVNMGIAIVVPADKIAETLNHPELIEFRRKNDERIANRNLPTPDNG